MPIFLKEEMISKPKEQKLTEIEAPFLDEISGLAIIQLLDNINSKYNYVESQIYAKCSNARYGSIVVLRFLY